MTAIVAASTVCAKEGLIVNKSKKSDTELEDRGRSKFVGWDGSHKKRRFRTDKKEACL